MRIEFRGNPQQRPQKFKPCRVSQTLAAKILYHARPIDIRQKAFIPQAIAAQGCPRRKIQDIGKLRLRAL